MFPGHFVEGRDVQQAYLQAKLEGHATFIVLPKDLWPEQMHAMKCPVLRLERALYGHVNSGVLWSHFCDGKCRDAGFVPISDCCPGVYWE